MHHLHDFASVNHTCPVITGVETAEPIAGTWTFHHIIFIVGIACTAITLLSSLLLTVKHLHRYTIPDEQRQIIRIINTPLVYSAVALLSLGYYSVAPYVQPLADLYEAFALASLFLLFVHYVAPDSDARPAFFNQLEMVSKSGEVTQGGSLRWFNLSWVMVFLYCVTKTILVIAQDASQAAGTYCASSNHLYFGHIWITVLGAIFVTLAVLSVFKFYGRFKQDMRTHMPLAKLVSFKLVVFLSVAQNLLFNFLNSGGHLHGSSQITHKDLSIGIPALLASVEGVLFSIFFQYSFRSAEYNPTNKPQDRRYSFTSAFFNSLNPSDLFSGILRAFGLLFTLFRKA